MLMKPLAFVVCASVLLSACAGGSDGSASRTQSEVLATPNPAHERILNDEHERVDSFIKTIGGPVSSTSIDGDTLTVKVDGAYFAMSPDAQSAFQQLLVTNWNVAFTKAHHLANADTHVNINGSEGTVWSN